MFFPPTMPSFMSLLSFPGLMVVNFDPRMFEQSCLALGSAFPATGGLF